VPVLGAARKIEGVVGVLSRFGRPLWVVNSAHNVTRTQCTRIDIREINGVRTTVITPFTLASRRLGKLGNILAAEWFARFFKRGVGLLWVYNSYAFEARFALALRKRHLFPFVLELEDLPRARARGLNPKPLVDQLYFQSLVSQAALVTCVNESIDELVRPRARETIVFPGLISRDLLDRHSDHVPFASAPYTLGYFGGLSDEKGADLVLALAARLPNHWRFVITGSGPLEEDLRRISDRSAGQISFRSKVDSRHLGELMRSCDALLNPHRDLAEFGRGIFPFKVLEALASQRLLITTPLVPCSIDLGGVCLEAEPSVEDLLKALHEAPKAYAASRRRIEETARRVIAQFSETGFYEKLSRTAAFQGLQSPPQGSTR
jgi:glycosyltransferase involved in cell wall biosynthesis